MPRKRNTAIVNEPAFDEVTEIEINGVIVRAGDEVRILQPPGKVTRLKRLSGSWYFQALVTNSKGSQWVNVYGGPNETTRVSRGRSLRAFDLERVEAIKPKKTRSKKSNVADSASSS